MTPRLDSEPGAVVLVVGAGRSGTSTVAGTLNRLGLYVPQPEVPADETNPRGFYEPQWVVDLHRRVLEPILVRNNDSRPRAVELVDAAGQHPALVDEVAEWLGAQPAHGSLVVKDPRTFWLLELWRRASDRVGREAAFLTMLRHPVEVTGSRASHYYAATEDEDELRARETTDVAGWCLATLVTERRTRGCRRTFVRYDELMTDWRATVRRVDEHLRLGVSAQLGDDVPHPVDEFIDPGLHRIHGGWEGSRAPQRLQELAEEVWVTASLLVASPGDQTAMDTLDRLHERYVDDFSYGVDLTLDHRRAEYRRVRREVRERTAARFAERVAALEQRNRDLEVALARTPWQRARAALGTARRRVASAPARRGRAR